MTSADSLEGMTPIGLDATADGIFIDWCDLADRDFSEPFFSQTVASALKADPTRRQVRTPVSALLEFVETHAVLKPDGLVFHMSRCGSTLTARLLMAVQNSFVIGEADPINFVLGPELPPLDPATHAALLQLVIGAMTAPHAASGKTRCFIKFSSWNILHLGLIRQAYPDVPWLFIHRDPVEVMVSAFAAPPAWLGLGNRPAIAAALTHIPAEEIQYLAPECFAARALANFCSAALANRDRSALMIDYAALPEPAWSQIQYHFGLAPDEIDAEKITAAQSIYSKDATNQTIFTGDSTAKQSSASAAMRDAAKQYLAPLTARLNSAEPLRAAG